MEHARRIGGENENMVIVFFPEGTRSRDGAMLPFKKGAFVLALQLGIPIIPVAVIGGRQVMGKGSLKIRSGRMKVIVGEPIPVEGLEFDARDGLVVQARAAVAALRGGEGPTEAPDPRARSAREAG
jgi:1-acyl-sn-glycerol-3-phosphate acyltransferase